MSLIPAPFPPTSGLPSTGVMALPTRLVTWSTGALSPGASSRCGRVPAACRIRQSHLRELAAHRLVRVGSARSAERHLYHHDLYFPKRRATLNVTNTATVLDVPLTLTGKLNPASDSEIPTVTTSPT